MGASSGDVSAGWLIFTRIDLCWEEEVDTFVLGKR